MAKVSTAGAWSVQSGTVVTPVGATQVTVINDGLREFHTTEDPAELIVALMVHLEIESIGK